MKIGLALGGGGARGFAHLGVIQAFEELHVPIHCVAGTSIGAIVGGIYAAGNLAAAHAWARESNWKKLPKLFLDPHMTVKGLVSGRKIEQFLRRLVPVSSFEDFKMPFAAVATDLETGEECVLKTGDVHSAIRASMSIPGVFNPVERDGRVLVDGGLVNVVPADVCRAMGAEKVIAVDLNGIGVPSAQKKPSSKLNVVDVLNRTFRIVCNHSVRHQFSTCAPDVLLQPPVTDVFVLDFRPAERLIEKGYDSVMSRREEILSTLSC